MNRPRRTHAAYSGAHKFKHDGARRYEAFEIFYLDRTQRKSGGVTVAGWYWRPMPVAGLEPLAPIGPFTSSRAAWRDACDQS